jgi:hypothetical protein
VITQILEKITQIFQGQHFCNAFFFLSINSRYEFWEQYLFFIKFPKNKRFKAISQDNFKLFGVLVQGNNSKEGLC